MNKASKALEALDELMSVYFENNQTKRKHGLTEETVKENVEAIRKELKVMEIIEDKRYYLDDHAIAGFMKDTEEALNFERFSLAYPQCPKEEYDVIREWMDLSTTWD